MADPKTPSIEESDDAAQKHAGGRPLLFATVDELDMAIQKYFDAQDPHVETHMIATGHTAKGETMFEDRKVLTDQKPYTMHGLARALGIDRKTLLNYKNRDEYFPSIQAALDRCAEYAEQALYTNASNGAKFVLTNNHGWTDKQVLAGDKDAPLMPVGLDAAILARRSGGEASSSPAADSDQ